MKNWLANATKKRVIAEVQQILRDHPRYREDSGNVSGSYSFDERPGRGVVVSSSSSDRVRLSADNYIGRVSSFVMLSPLENYPGTSLEWATENLALLEKVAKKRDVFPSPPGIYTVTIQTLPDEPTETPGQFVVDTLLTVTGERVITFDTSSDVNASLMRDGIHPGSVRLWLDGKRALVEGVDFTVDPATGDVTFTGTTPTGSTITADYRYSVPQTGPFYFQRDQFNVEAIPGAVIAFGDRVQAGDKMAVVVFPERQEAVDVYGGKFEVSFDLLAFTQDSEDRERLADYLTSSILSIQNRLGYEGLELVDLSPGGESEEVRNDASDDYWYDRTISMTVRVDWEVYQPLPLEMWRWEATSKSTEIDYGYLEGSAPVDLVRAVTAPETVGLQIVIGKHPTYESIR